MGQGNGAGQQRAEPEAKKPTRRHDSTDHKNKTEAKGDKSTSDASFQTQIRTMNSRTYQTAHDHTRKGGSTWGTAASAYQEDEPGKVIRHRNKAQDHRFTDKYQEGKAMPGDYAARHAAPNEGRDEEEQERQGNIHGDFHRGRLDRGPTRQGAGRRTRERGQGRERGGRGDQMWAGETRCYDRHGGCYKHA